MGDSQMSPEIYTYLLIQACERQIPCSADMVLGDHHHDPTRVREFQKQSRLQTLVSWRGTILRV